MHRKSTVCALLAVTLLTGCAGPLRVADHEITAPVVQPATQTDPNGRVFTVDSKESQIRIVVEAAGPLAGFGHAHVIGGAALSGQVWLAEPFHNSGLELFIDTASLMVDEPDWRRDEGLNPQVPVDAITGTLRNLRSAAVLDIAQHPKITVRSVALSGPRWQPDITIEVTLRGVTRVLTVPVALTVNAASIVASGHLRLRQTEFGLAPFSALGGGLRVADEFSVRLRISAHAVSIP